MIHMIDYLLGIPHTDASLDTVSPFYDGSKLALSVDNSYLLEEGKEVIKSNICMSHLGDPYAYFNL